MCPTAVSDNPKINHGITLYPVPVSDGILTIESSYKALKLIEIYNVAGQRVLRTNGNGNFSKQINVIIMDAGIYFIKLEQIGQSKIIIN
jgi:hypothetical protein